MRSILLYRRNRAPPCVSTASSRRGAGFCQSRNDFVAEHSASYPSSFMILTGVLIHTKGIEKILSPLKPVFRFFLGTDVYGGYVFILGMVCGYPMAAKLASDLYETGRISRIEALYLTTFAVVQVLYLSSPIWDIYA